MLQGVLQGVCSLQARTLLGSPGRTTRNKKLLGAKDAPYKQRVAASLEEIELSGNTIDSCDAQLYHGP